MSLRLLRWASAIVCLVAATFIARSPAISGTMVSGAISMLAFFSLLIVGLVFVGRDLARLFSWPLTCFVDVIYGTGPGDGKPPLNYHLARGYTASGRFEEAVDEYARIMTFYPRELEPYSECIRILLEIGDDPSEAARYLHRGLRHLRGSASKKRLRAAYRESLKALASSRITNNIDEASSLNKNV
jgi:hypothetical protein